MTKTEDVKQEWETLKILANSYKGKISDGELEDLEHLIKHYQNRADIPAQNWDSQERSKKEAIRKNQPAKVQEYEKEQNWLLEQLKPLNETRERLTQKLGYMENTEKILTELTALKNNLENYKCSCNTYSIETKVDAIIEILGNTAKKPTQTTEIQTEPVNKVKKPEQVEETSPPIVETPSKSTEELEKEQKAKELQELKDEVGKLVLNDLEKVLLKDSEDKEHIEAIRNQAQTRIDKENEVSAKQLAENKEKQEQEAKEKAEAEQRENERLIQEQVEKERLEKEVQELADLKKEVEQLNPNPTEKQLLTNAPDKAEVEKVRTQINERLAKEQAERDKWVKEFQNFKTEIEKLGLNSSEQKQLDDAIDKWQAEKVKSDAEARIKEEIETKKIEQEKKEREIADIIFNADKNIFSQYKAFFNSFSDFENNVKTFWSKQPLIVPYLLYKTKNGNWGVIRSDFHDQMADSVYIYWCSPSNKENWDIELREITDLFQSLNLTSKKIIIPRNWQESEYSNKENSVKYSLLWSLTAIKKLRNNDFYSNSISHSWMRDNENKWLPQMEKEFADAEKL